MAKPTPAHDGRGYPISREPDHLTHPGPLLGEELEARGVSQKEFAALIGRSPRTISEIVRGRAPITAETALRIEQAFGIRADVWVNLQTRYDLRLARQKQSA